MTTENKPKTLGERISDLIKDAAKKDYHPEPSPKGLIMSLCYECRDTLTKKYGRSGWRKAMKGKKAPYTAIVFIRKSDGAKLIACPCGFRRLIKRDIICISSGQHRASPISIVPAKTCWTKGCNNPVPDGRKLYCHSCRPPAKVKPPKESQSAVY